MWEELLKCAAPGPVAFCIPWPAALGGPALAIYWYGILASVGIFAGSFYASKHVEMEGEDPDQIWDMLLWVLIPALIGARLWYVLQAVIGGSTDFTLANPLTIINPRTGGMNIFGGAVLGVIALIIYARATKVDGWLLADASLMGLFIGQAIGRLGNFINVELYGPPTGSDWFGMLVPADRRLAIYQSLPEQTRFHPTMFYEMGWLLLSFAVIYLYFRRNQEQIVHGVIAGAYLILSGFGRFWIEFLRPDQPRMPSTMLGGIFSYSQLLSVVYIAAGIIIVLDRTRHFRIPWIARPQTQRQRQQAFQAILSERRRAARTAEKEKLRAERRKLRATVRQQREEDEPDDTTSPSEGQEAR